MNRFQALVGLAGIICGAGCSTEDTATEGGKVAVKCIVNKESLGIKLKIGSDYGSVHLELTNNGTKDMSVGNDMLISFENSKFEAALLASGKDRTDDADRSMMYATEANLFSGVQDGKLTTYVYGAGGQGFNFDASSAEKYTGSWADKLPAGGTAVVAQQLMTWPESQNGWVATPALTSTEPKAIPFRLIARLGEGADKPIVLPMTVAALDAFVKDNQRPTVLRNWAIGWLAVLPGDQGWQTASKYLQDKQMPEELRKSAARWLATQASPMALQLVDKVMWDTATNEELQLTCYYALTWSPHDDAKALTKKAASHPHKKIRESAAKAK